MTDQSTQTRYTAALQLVQSQVQLLWTVLSAFLVVHGLLTSFLLEAVFDPKTTNHMGLAVMAIIALLLCIPWYASYDRASRLYRLRMAQAREAEPDDIDLLKGKVRQFLKGESVEIGDESHELSWPAKTQVRVWVTLTIVMFALGYVWMFCAAMSRLLAGA